MIRVAFFEDHPIVVKSLTSVIEEQANMELVFSSSTKHDLYETLAVHSTIDVIILDLLAADVNGLEVFDYVTKNYPSIKIISFTTLSSPILVENILTIGAKGYVNKNQDLDDLIEAINTIYSGLIYLPDDYSFLIKMEQSSKKNTLTEREIEIVQLISREFTTSDIAQQLLISINTIENHRKNIFTKLNVKNVAGMVREAASLGYLN